MANNCAVCGTSVNVFQAQKLADGNYLCRKGCCKKALKYFDFAHSTLPEYQAHVEQVEKGTEIWNQLFEPKFGKLESKFEPVYVAPDLGLMALVETHYKFLGFGATRAACIYRIDELVGYETEEETKTEDGKKETKYDVHYSFRNDSGMSDFRIEYPRKSLCDSVEIYFNNLFGIQKTLGNSLNNWHRQKNAIKGIASAVSAAAKGANDAMEKENAAFDALDAAVYGDRRELKAKADAALAPFK